jgi:hypothetical protein
VVDDGCRIGTPAAAVGAEGKIVEKLDWQTIAKMLIKSRFLAIKLPVIKN